MPLEDQFEFDAAGEQCAVCGKEVAGGGGFAHLRHENEMVALCCPLCLETFRRNPDGFIARRRVIKIAGDIRRRLK